MESTPPKDYPFAFTLAELFDLTSMIEKRQREIEIKLGEAYIAHNKIRQKALHISLERVSNLHDMLIQPINTFSDEMMDLGFADAEADDWVTGDDDGYDPNDATDPYEGVDGDDLRDYLYKN